LPSEQHDGEMAGVVEIADIVTVLETELPLLSTEGRSLG
jgi:hypothetical protein